MKQFKITKNNKDYIIRASNNVEAVKKLRDSKLKDKTYYKPTGGWFYGIYGMEFIWNGTQSDPYIRYKGRVVNYYDVEDALYEDYKEDLKYNGYKGEFEKWVKENASMAKYYAENAPQVRMRDEDVGIEEQTEEIEDKAVRDAKRYEKKGLAEFTINDTHKAYCIGTMDGFNEKWNEAGLRQHAKKAIESADYIRTLESKGYREDMQKAYLNDSKLKDYKYVDDRDISHFAEYGWSIPKELPRDCYWEATEELAGKLKTKQEYIREIPKLAKQKLDDYLKKIKVEFDKLINEARAQSSIFSNWAPDQAEAILKKQFKKDSASVKDYNWETMPIPKAGATFPFKSKMSKSQFDNYVKDLKNRYPMTSYKTYNETEMGLDIILVYATVDNRHVATYVPSTQMLYTEIRV